MARVASMFLFLFAIFNFSIAKELPPVDYDAIIVGGGPAGLSALSALCRVSRRAVLFDTAQYRNNATRNMHDVIGADGAPPNEFRHAAREQIKKYKLATFVNKKVTHMEYEDIDKSRVFTAVDIDGNKYTARRVVLATGVTDLLPETPGVMDAFGKGMYWCPWCDGFEHRDQSLAVVGPLSDALSSVLEMHNINPDTIILANGTDTPAERAIATNRSKTWQEQLNAYSVPVINNSIVSIERLRDGGSACSSPKHGTVPQQVLSDEPKGKVIPVEEDAGPNGKHYDLFRVKFQDGLMIDRAAFLINIPTVQTSTLPTQMNLEIKDNKVVVNVKTLTSVDGVFACGDMNSEGATNVPHAMYNGKRAGVVIHVSIAKEESMASIAKRSLSSMMSTINDAHLEEITWQKIGNELEDIWDHIKTQFAS